VKEIRINDSKSYKDYYEQTVLEAFKRFFGDLVKVQSSRYTIQKGTENSEYAVFIVCILVENKFEYYVPIDVISETFLAALNKNSFWFTVNNLMPYAENAKIELMKLKGRELTCQKNKD
jgi:hypothetical protein